MLRTAVLGALVALTKAQLSPTEPDYVCYFQGKDYLVAGCGYATLLSIADNDPVNDAASWFSGDRSVEEGLSEPWHCQELCAAFEGCAYFSMEVQDDAPTARCYLKEAYAEEWCTGYSARPALALIATVSRHDAVAACLCH